MPQTYTFDVDNSGTPESIVTQSFCNRIIIYENDQNGTTDYVLRYPSSSSPAITRPAGSKTEITLNGKTQAGNTVGFIATVTGTVTFAQEEYLDEDR